MATAILHSFAELAAVLGNDKVKAKKVSSLASFTNIEDRCGRKAAVIWAFMQDQESCKRYGPKGAILHDVESICKATNYEASSVVNAVVSLVVNGYAKATANGKQVRAA